MTVADLLEPLKARLGMARAHVERVDTPARWRELAARHGYQTVSRTETVKFVVDLLDAGRTYFFDSNRWETHYGFVQRFIDPRVDHDTFLAREYFRDDRRFLLGAVTHYLDGGHWTLELSSGDTMDAGRLVELFGGIRSRVAFVERLCFRPASPHQIQIAERIRDRVPVLSRDAINASVVYQPIVLGEAYGHLRFAAGRLDLADVRPYDILVTEEVPDEISPVAGLITSQLQAPLAHVAVLSRNRNTPDMACRGAFDMPALRALEGEVVKLTVGGQDFKVEKADPAQAQRAWDAMRPCRVRQPEVDVRIDGPVCVRDLPPDAQRYAGAKAGQLAVLGRIGGITTPAGFVIPFACYLAHLERAGLDARIDAMLADGEFRSSATMRAQRLAELRDAIRAQPVEPALLASVMAAIADGLAGRRLILRSSTNAEDLPGFNGAGLYESIALPEAAEPVQFEATLREVWASVWLQRAFEEREWYRIDHRRVAMAVLVQPYLDDVVATGVAITGNPFKCDLSGLFINVQAKGATVTGALGNEIPEQYLVATWTPVHEVELLSRSSLSPDRLILDDADLKALTVQLQAVHDAMLPPDPGLANAMDVEFVLLPDRSFVMVQARPHKITYGVDRPATVADEPRLRFLIRLLRRVAYRFIPNRLAYERQE